MAVPPFVGADAPIGVYQLVYSLVFFAAALFIALRPEKLTDRLGNQSETPLSLASPPAEQ